MKKFPCACVLRFIWRSHIKKTLATEKAETQVTAQVTKQVKRFVSVLKEEN
jgi:hypothetical protein